MEPSEQILRFELPPFDPDGELRPLEEAQPNPPSPFPNPVPADAPAATLEEQN